LLGGRGVWGEMTDKGKKKWRNKKSREKNRKNSERKIENIIGERLI
jgi:hypothetical protein